MKQLEKTITRKGFLYTQIDRTDEKAIYSQHYIDGGQLIGHEIFYIKIQKEGEFKGIHFEEKEHFPNDNDFGVIAWSVGKDLERAMKKYDNLPKLESKAA